ELSLLIFTPFVHFYLTTYNFTLRVLLWREKAIPFFLRSFLNTVADKTGLVEIDGVQWRFRHQLIQDELSKSYLNTQKICPTK
ncbi:hypothetical protein, partial [Spirosoma migulaei]